MSIMKKPGMLFVVSCANNFKGHSFLYIGQYLAKSVDGCDSFTQLYPIKQIILITWCIIERHFFDQKYI